jgi:hypothetical protein
VSTAALVECDERDWSPSSKTGWFAMVDAPLRQRPAARAVEQLAAMGPPERLAYDHARAVWHANIGPIRTPQMDVLFERLDEIVGANRQDGDKVKPTAVLDALPGLGKTTAVLAFGQAFHRTPIQLFGPEVAVSGGAWQRIPVAYVGLTSNTTMRSLNAMLCRFYGLPGVERGTAESLAQRAAECVAHCKTRLIIVDDVHFLDVNRRDGREVANHFKWLANTFPVTFLFVGAGLRARGLLDEGLSGADAAFSQTARRWSVLSLDPFEIATDAGRRTWRQLLLGIEREVVLARGHRGMVARLSRWPSRRGRTQDPALAALARPRPPRTPRPPAHRAHPRRLAHHRHPPRGLPAGHPPYLTGNPDPARHRRRAHPTRPRSSPRTGRTPQSPRRRPRRSRNGRRSRWRPANRTPRTATGHLTNDRG